MQTGGDNRCLEIVKEPPKTSWEAYTVATKTKNQESVFPARKSSIIRCAMTLSDTAPEARVAVWLS